MAVYVSGERLAAIVSVHNENELVDVTLGEPRQADRPWLELFQAPPE